MRRNNRRFGTKLNRENVPGYFRKWSGLGCRKAGCLLCHYSKHFGFKTIDELRAELAFREQMEEYDRYLEEDEREE